MRVELHKEDAWHCELFNHHFSQFDSFSVSQGQEQCYETAYSFELAVVTVDLQSRGCMFDFRSGCYKVVTIGWVTVILYGR